MKLLRHLKGVIRGVRDHGELALMETLDSIEKSSAARLTENRDQYRALSRRTRTLLRRDREIC